MIEWDSSQTVPLYYLCNCPIFMQDVDCRVMRKYWKANKLARKLLLSTLLHHYPKGSSERKAVRWCFKEKSS